MRLSESVKPISYVNTPLIMLRIDKGLHALATKALRG